MAKKQNIKKKVSITNNELPSLIQKFGKVIRLQRHRLNLSQQEAADLADVSVNLLRQVEAGKPTAHFDKILDILTAVGFQFHMVPGNQRILLPDAL